MLPLTYLLAALPVVLALPAASVSGNVTVPGKYIVILKPDVKVSEMNTHMTWVTDVHSRSITRRDSKGIDKVWEDNFKGYSGEFDDKTLEEIAQSDEVCFHLQELDQTLRVHMLTLSRLLP